MTSVGVIMTCFNEGPYIGAAVDSVLTQTRADLIEKIVIVDDGSRPDTRDALAAIARKDPRIEIIYEKGKGAAANRNLAAARCGGEWIAMLDGDDLWLPEKLERQQARIAARPEAGLIYTGLAYFGEADPTPRPAAVADLSHAPDLEKAYFTRDGPITSTIMVNRAVFEKTGGYDATLRMFEDTEFYARLAGRTRFAFLSEVLVHKRRHADAVTARRQGMMAHQAQVTFLIAARNPRLASLVPRRLSRAARKLGNAAIGDRQREEALGHYRMAASLNPFSVLAWLSCLALYAGVPLGGIRDRIIRRRQAAA